MPFRITVLVSSGVFRGGLFLGTVLGDFRKYALHVPHYVVNRLLREFLAGKSNSDWETEFLIYQFSAMHIATVK